MILNQLSYGSSGGPIQEPFLELEVNSTNILNHNTQTSRIIDISGATSADDYVLYYAYFDNQNISGRVNFSSFTDLGYEYCLAHCFELCGGITYVDLSGLRTVSNIHALDSTCKKCPSLTTFDADNLQIVTTEGTFKEVCRNDDHLTTLKMTNIYSINGKNAFESAFEDCTSLGNVFWDNLNNVSNERVLSRCFKNCSSMKIFSVINLKNISGNYALSQALENDISLNSLNFDSLETVKDNYSFYRMCSNTDGISGYQLQTKKHDFPLLKTVFGNNVFEETFMKCDMLGVIGFPSLGKIPGSRTFFRAFNSAKIYHIYFYNLDSSSFGSNTNQFEEMLINTSSVSVHFPMRIQNIIGTWTDVMNGFGESTTNITFDIVTEISDGVEIYKRSEKDSNNGGIAWLMNGILYYTDENIGEPNIGDTIFIDQGCTIPYSQISTIG